MLSCFIFLAAPSNSFAGGSGFGGVNAAGQAIGQGIGIANVGPGQFSIKKHNRNGNLLQILIFCLDSCIECGNQNRTDGFGIGLGINLN